MIFESALWLPSILPGMCCARMKDERKRMNAFGGRGMYDASRFFACEPRVAASTGEPGGESAATSMSSPAPGSGPAASKAL